jgi:hypothetical protein
MVKLHPHAQSRLTERGITAEEVVQTVLHGEPFAAKLGRSGFRRNFAYNDVWLGNFYRTKQVQAIAVR